VPTVSDPAPIDERGRGTPLDSGPASLRERTARGAVVNGAFLASFYSLGLLRGFVVAAFLSLSDYGVWGILAIALGAMLQLKQVGIGDKYVQQSDSHQELAFQQAMTLELMATGVCALLLAAGAPLLAVIYGRPELLLPGLVLALAPIGIALQAPVWIFYRRLDFLAQRRLQAVDPGVAFVVTVVLAVWGAGYWSLVIGTVAGAWIGGLVALRACPYRLALRLDGAKLREYAGFSGPLLVASLCPIIMGQVAVLAAEQVLGLAAVGVIVLASAISDYANRVDAILTETLYPTICAVRDRADLMLEAFVKSNRLALMWGVPFGVGLALFAPDLVDFVLGVRWRPGVALLQAFGLIAAVNHVGYNWDAFYRAHGKTRPIAVWSTVSLVFYLACALPLLILEGLDGFAIGMAAVTTLSLIIRAIYLQRLLTGLRIFRHTARAIVPSLPAVAVVLGARALEPSARSPVAALLELAVYLGVTALATLVLERRLVAEVAGYLRRGRAAPRAAPITS